MKASLQFTYGLGLDGEATASGRAVVGGEGNDAGETGAERRR